MLRMIERLCDLPLLRIVLDIYVIRSVSHTLGEESQVRRAHHHVKQRITRMSLSSFYFLSNSNRIHLAAIQTVRVYDLFLCIQFEQCRFLAFANVLIQSKAAIQTELRSRRSARLGLQILIALNV